MNSTRPRLGPARVAILALPLFFITVQGPVEAQEYLSGDQLECSFNTSQGTKILSWNPDGDQLVFDGKPLTLLGPPQVSSDSLLVRMAMDDYEAEMTYLGDRGTATIHVQWNGGGTSLWGPCKLNRP